MVAQASMNSRSTRWFALAVTVLLTATGLLMTPSQAHAAAVTTTVNGITFIADDTNVSAGATATGYDPAIGGTTVAIPGTVTINGTPYPVTTIGSRAFWDNQLTQVTIPDSVTTIDSQGVLEQSSSRRSRSPTRSRPSGIQAFRDNQLTQVTIPDSVTTIGLCVLSQSAHAGHDPHRSRPSATARSGTISSRRSRSPTRSRPSASRRSGTISSRRSDDP